jgi:hypothetical protein
MILETTEVRYDITVKLQCVKQLIMKVQYIKLYESTFVQLTYNLPQERKDKQSDGDVTAPV